MQYTRARAAFTLILKINRRSNDLRLSTAVLRGQTSDIRFQSLEITGPGIVDEIVHGFRRECDWQGGLWLWC